MVPIFHVTSRGFYLFYYELLAALKYSSSIKIESISAPAGAHARPLRSSSTKEKLKSDAPASKFRLKTNSAPNSVRFSSKTRIQDVLQDFQLSHASLGFANASSYNY